MMYEPFILREQCCFFPGKVLDEGFRILNEIALGKPLRNEESGFQMPYTSADRCLTEFYDLTTMATEYFESAIRPSLEKCEKNRFQNQLAQWCDNVDGKCEYSNDLFVVSVI